MAFDWSKVGSAVAGSVVDGLFGLGNNALSYHENLALQHDAQSWQERMSNTAHQREVADLQNAGLNPILTATGGSGASTGSVGANSASPQAIQPGTDFMNLLNSSAQFDFTRSQAENMRQDSILKGSQTLVERQRILNMIQELEESKSRVRGNEAKIKEIDANIALMHTQIRGIDSTIKLNAFNQNQAYANTQLLNEQTDAIRNSASNRFNKEHPVVSSLLEGYGRFSDSTSKLIHGGSAIYDSQTRREGLRSGDYDFETVNYDRKGNVRSRSSSRKRNR